MYNFIALFVKYKGKLLLVSLASVLAIVYIENKDVPWIYDFNDYITTFAKLKDAQGIDAPDNHTGMSSASTSFIEENRRQSVLSLLNYELIRDDLGNIVPPEKMIKPVPEVKTLTLAAGEESSYPYSVHFDSSYKYSYPEKKRLITYLPIEDHQALSGYICVGGNMKRTFDEEKPASKKDCINLAQSKFVEKNKAQMEKQRKTQLAIEQINQEQATALNEKAALESKLKSVPSIYATNIHGDCFEFKNIHYEEYLRTGYAFATPQECFTIGDAIKDSVSWYADKEKNIAKLMILAFLSALPFLVWLALTLLLKLVSTTGNATIGFLAKASKAINHEKKINIKADITIKKDD